MTARILVVDDILPNIKLLEAKLSAEYFDVLSASDGETAVEIATATGSDVTPESARILFRETAGRYEAFLDAHPGSPARAEIRFRLADVLMTNARDDFHGQMAQFVGSSPTPTPRFGSSQSTT